MKANGDSRLKSVAMRCSENMVDCEAKKAAFLTLLKIKNDEEVEQFFVDYLIDNTGKNDKHNRYVHIANSYW